MVSWVKEEERDGQIFFFYSKCAKLKFLGVRVQLWAQQNRQIEREKYKITEEKRINDSKH